ncbi:glycosyltransferase family 4 protein [Rhizobium sp. BK068]|uniref:glycosyltransferase family 4 protein n=1 Tax=Rhizobium sp. BK068 TaxID=2512130 RepID=UPI0010535CA1|nr:glycosyltransferase family 4 protein [Rhizobium sp. BK068]TCM68598.1 glycosyltransferase involved in cell wall biosynthesis [Rhizobium sp. BK068]
MTRHIIAIGQLPPPFSGFSLATRSMIALLEEGNSVTNHDVSPPFGKLSLLKHPIKLNRVLGACRRLVRDRKHDNRICYLACEGGPGLVYTALIVLVARLLAYPIYLHHHSFSYIDRASLLMRCVLAFGDSRLRHIFSCDVMRDRFTDTYQRRMRSSIVSNAAYVVPTEQNDAPRYATTLVIGMLSHLGTEKGLDTFLDLARQARHEGLSIRAILAGPAGTGERAAIDAAVMELGDMLDYRGALYDDAKAAFYREIDVLVLPTTYGNEAQPLVIFEAKAAGNAVISTDRGCIRKQLDESDLLAPADDEFVPTALAWLSAVAPGPALDARRKVIRQAYRTRHAKARAAIDTLFDLEE